MALKNFTPAVELPEAAKNALELAENRVSTLEGEKTRLQGAVQDLRNESVSLEHLVVEKQEALKALELKLADTNSQITSNNATIEAQGLIIADLASDARALKLEIDGGEDKDGNIVIGLKKVKENLLEAIKQLKEVFSGLETKKTELNGYISGKKTKFSELVAAIKNLNDNI
jgi:chromosome segregation ATPase